MRIQRSLLLAFSMVLATGLAHGGTGNPQVLLGDGFGKAVRYNPQARSLRVYEQDVLLSPEAVVSLEMQLGQQALIVGRPFDARFNVSVDGAGQRVIDSIYVFPLKRGQEAP